MAYIFLSYSKHDIRFARHLRLLLENQGFEVWMDETKLAPSTRWWSMIEHNIIECAAFIIVMTPNSKVSDWVEREILVAEDRRYRKPLFPILLEANVGHA